jgi:hypothetical protein
MVNNKPKNRAIVEGALLASVDRTGEMIDRCRDGVYQLIRSGELESFLIGRRRHVTVASIKRYVERQIAKNKTYTPHRQPNEGRAPP